VVVALHGVSRSWLLCRVCCNSLLYKGSEDDVGLGLEVTGWVWNKIKSTKAMMI
jgi:hypothetical protein